jgi:hypothetical protein
VLPGTLSPNLPGSGSEPSLRLSFRFETNQPRALPANRAKRSSRSRNAEPALKLALVVDMSRVRPTARSAPDSKPSPIANEARTPRPALEERERATGRRSTDDDGPNAPEQPVPFDPRPATIQRRVGTEKPAGSSRDSSELGLPEIGDTEWALAPIRWSGNTVSSLNLTQAPGSSFLNDQNTGTFSASSYVVAPYVAQWSGNVNFNLGRSTYSSLAGNNVKSSSNGLGFGLGADILPQSRYPLSVNFSLGQSETRAFDLGQKTNYSNFQARQQYRPEEGRERYGAAFVRNSFDTATGKSATTSFLGDFSTSAEFDFDHLLEGRHSIAANFGLTSSDAALAAENSRNLTSKVSHGWWVHEDLNINSSLEFARNQRVAASGNTTIDNKSNLLLGTSTFTWRPFEDHPLTLNGGANLISTQVTSGGVNGSLLNLSGNVNGTYRFNQNLSASGGVSAGMVSSSTGTRSLVNTQSGGVAYSGDPLTLMGFNYGWNVGASASRSASSNGGGFFGTSLSAGHSLMRNLTVIEGQTINFTANQSVSRSTTEQGPSSTLSNSLAAAWATSLSESLRGNLSATFSDSLSNGQTGTTHFQSANLAGGGAYQFSRFSNLNVNANLSWSRTLSGFASSQTLNGIIIDNSLPSIIGNLTVGYTHRNLFSVPRLNYVGNLMYINNFSNLRVEGGYRTKHHDSRACLCSICLITGLANWRSTSGCRPSIKLAGNLLPSLARLAETSTECLPVAGRIRARQTLKNQEKRTKNVRSIPMAQPVVRPACSGYGNNHRYRRCPSGIRGRRDQQLFGCCRNASSDFPALVPSGSLPLQGLPCGSRLQIQGRRERDQYGEDHRRPILRRLPQR